MRRYYLSKIFLDNSGMFPVWKHALQDHPNVDYEGGEIKVDQATGIPTEKALLVLVGAKNHKQFVDDPKMVQIPAGRDGLNVQIGATDTPTKLNFRAKAKSLGLADADVEAMTDNTKSWRNAVDALGKKNNPAFDPDNFDLGED